MLLREYAGPGWGCAVCCYWMLRVLPQHTTIHSHIVLLVRYSTAVGCYARTECRARAEWRARHCWVR
eukprot:3940355-Rhodomonas_salina.2